MVELYKKTEGTPVIKALLEGPTVRASLEAMLQAAAESVCGQNKPRGCLMVLGGINCSPANKGIEDFLRQQRAIRDKVIRQRLRRGIDEGDLPASTDVNGLVAFYTSVADGMAIRARDGASRKSLLAIVECAMPAWDKLLQ